MQKSKNAKFKPRTEFGCPNGALPYGELLLRKQRVPTLHITAQAHGKMWALVQECPIEIGWLSTCTRVGNDDFVIDDVFVPDQHCSVASTTITKDGEANLLSALLNAGQAASVNRLNCWGHSHVNMAVFASGTDEQQTTVSLKRCKQDHFIRVIANKRGDLFSSVYLLDADVVLHHPKLVVDPSNPSQWREWARKEIAAHVTREVLSVQLGMETEFDLSDVSPQLLKYWFDEGAIDEALYLRLKKAAPKAPVRIRRRA